MKSGWLAVEPIGGTVVRLGQELGIPTPVNEVLARMIRVGEGV